MLANDFATESRLPFSGYELLYEISSVGRLRRKSASRMAPAGYLLKCRLDKHGYPRYQLCKQRKFWTVKAHRLVAIPSNSWCRLSWRSPNPSIVWS